MKAAVVRKLAGAHSAAELDAMADRLAEGESVEVEGEDDGERLTHLMLASRIAARVESGVDAKEAFRGVMSEVRDVLGNPSGGAAGA